MGPGRTSLAVRFCIKPLPVFRGNELSYKRDQGKVPWCMMFVDDIILVGEMTGNK